MSNNRFFDYYYGRESEQFTFFRIPKLLITDPYFSSLSAEAKLLYGLLMDRMNLSRMNAWYDDQGRVFIMYPIREIFANCYGGVIILGVMENEDGSWRATGLQNEAKIR